MLALLDQGAGTCYRIPVNLVTNKDPYPLAAYIATLRFSTRFNEASGSINQFIDYFGVKVDSHVGASIERMRKGLVRLCELGILDYRIYDMRKLGPNQWLRCGYKKNKGWTYDEYPLGILFSVKEISQASRTAKKCRWLGVDNLIDVLHLTGYLRAHMDCPVDNATPTVRFQQSAATVDYKTILSALDITDKKLTTRLKRMQKAGLGVYQIVTLTHPDTGKNQKIVLLANKSSASATVLTRSRNNLKSYYDGYKLTVG